MKKIKRAFKRLRAKTRGFISRGGDGDGAPPKEGGGDRDGNDGVLLSTWRGAGDRPRRRARTSQNRRPFQRDNRHPQTSQGAGSQGLNSDHRRHGSPEEGSAPCRQTGRGLCSGVKKNQPRLWGDIAGAFEYGERTRFASIEHDVFETVNKGHGRVERRRRLGDVRRLALNLAKGEKSLKIGVAAKRTRAGGDLEYLRAILQLAQ